MRLAVIIVNYNVKYFLEQALLSVRRAMQGIDGEVWVVDNNSVDGSVRLVQDKFPEVKLIANSDNPGFSKANNQAIRETNADYVLLLNPDTVVQEDTFSKVIRFMDEHPDAGGLGVKMIDGRGHFLPESKRGLPTPRVAFYKMFGLAKLFPRSREFGRYHLGYLDKNQTHEVEVLAGAFMLLRKSVLDEIGLLDETFFMYGEDIDLSYRITQAGYKNYYFPETTIIHYKGESTKKTSVNYVFVFYRAMVIFAKKHFSGSFVKSFGFFINMAIWFRAFLALMQRAWLRIRFPLLDAGLLLALSYGLKIYWEQNHRFIYGGEYPEKYMYINVPVYLACWILGLYFAGTYRRNHGLRSIAFGMFYGTVAIAVLYAFAPDSLRFSRALILLGGAVGALVLMSYRLLVNAAKYKSLDYGQQHAMNTLIIGDGSEANRVHGLLQESAVPHNFIGYVSVQHESPEADSYLGHVGQLNEIVQVFNANELIFCGKDIASSEIIAWMNKLDAKDVSYKIVPEESLYIIGSNSKNTNGELYTIDLQLKLADSNKRSEKRIFDVLSAMTLLATFPILIWWVAHKGSFLKNLVQVIWGQKTWVGYIDEDSSRGLPDLAPSVLSPVGDHARHLSISPSVVNFRYARDYSVNTDLQLLLSNLRHLGG